MRALAGIGHLGRGCGRSFGCSILGSLVHEVKGRELIHLRDRTVELGPGEFFVVPRGVEHKPESPELSQVVLFEPASTRNTGKVDHTYTIEAGDLERI